MNDKRDQRVEKISRMKRDENRDIEKESKKQLKKMEETKLKHEEIESDRRKDLWKKEQDYEKKRS